MPPKGCAQRAATGPGRGLHCQLPVVKAIIERFDATIVPGSIRWKDPTPTQENHHDERSDCRAHASGPADAGQDQKAQEALGSIEVEGQAGSGLVKLVMTGKHQVRSVSIDPSLMSSDPDDLETLQDLLIAAVNDAVAKVDKVSEDQMASATAGMPLPPGFKL